MLKLKTKWTNKRIFLVLCLSQQSAEYYLNVSFLQETNRSNIHGYTQEDFHEGVLSYNFPVFFLPWLFPVVLSPTEGSPVVLTTTQIRCLL